jgi:hypothetical protein
MALFTDPPGQRIGERSNPTAVRRTFLQPLSNACACQTYLAFLLQRAAIIVNSYCV